MYNYMQVFLGVIASKIRNNQLAHFTEPKHTKTVDFKFATGYTTAMIRWCGPKATFPYFICNNCVVRCDFSCLLSVFMFFEAFFEVLRVGLFLPGLFRRPEGSAESIEKGRG